MLTFQEPNYIAQEHKCFEFPLANYLHLNYLVLLSAPYFSASFLIPTFPRLANLRHLQSVNSAVALPVLMLCFVSVNF